MVEKSRPGDKFGRLLDMIREALINSEFPQHVDVLPFLMADKPLKMKKKIK